MNTKALILFMTLIFFSSGLADMKETFTEANGLYRSNDFQGAIDRYHSIIESGHESGELYFNLGNADFKLGDLGHSILYFEKAKIFLPNDDDLEHNLELARMRVADKIVVPRLAIWNFVDDLRDFWPLTTLTILTLSMFLISLGLFTAYLNINRGYRKKLLFYASLPFFVLFIFHTINLCDRIWRIENIHEAVLIKDKVEVRSAPNEDGMGLFSLHEGVKFRIKQNLDPWAEIELPDGKKGWIKVESYLEI